MLLATTAMVGFNVSAAQAEPNVVTSIKPVHSLVAGVMEGVAEPTLLVEGAGSPHTFSLRPSQARALQQADIVFWVGPQLETFLSDPIENIGGATVVTLSEAHDMISLPVRESATFEGHDHGDHAGHDDHGHDEHAGHDDHGHDEHAGHDDHGHEEHAGHDDHEHDEHAGHDDHGHDDHDEHADHAGHEDHGHEEHASETHDEHDDHGHDEHAHAGHDDHNHADGIDVHFWLDPVNAKAFVHEIGETLAKVDPDNASAYAANAERVEARLDALTADITAQLEPVKDRPFIVFHDAYQYFENRFGVQAAGSITVSPETMPGAQRIGEIQDKVQELQVTCVFSEPQFNANLVAVVADETNANTAVLDPLGANIEDGPDLYFTLIRDMADSIQACLTEDG